MIGTEIKERKSFYKYPHIRYLGDAETEGLFLDEVIISEKLDGANSSFHIHNGELVFGSRNVFLGPNPDNDWKKLAEYVKGKIQADGEGKAVQLNPDFVYYCEYMRKHTLNYDWERTPVCVGFDILDKNTELFVRGDIAQKEFEKIGIEFVPVIFRKKGSDVKVDELKQFVEQNQSKYGEFPGEGIVIKNYFRMNRFERPLFGKIVRDTFKEQNKLAFSGLKELRDTERQMVEEFCTPARVRKIVQKLTLEEGHELNMTLMPFLFRVVSEDILTEAILEIEKRYSSIQFKEFRNMVAAKCAKELKNYMVENQK